MWSRVRNTIMPDKMEVSIYTHIVKCNYIVVVRQCIGIFTQGYTEINSNMICLWKKLNSYFETYKVLEVKNTSYNNNTNICTLKYF